MNQLDRAINEVGSQKLLAEACGVKPMSVSLWKKKGVVPVGRVLAICEATKWKVRPNDLRPDIYTDKNWLPPEAKKK